jgi:hypothetical protein
MNAQRILFAAFFFSLPALASCAGQLYKVATVPVNAPPTISASNTSGLSAGAIALDEDQSVGQFEANLPLAGVIAVDVRLSNQSAEMIDVEKLRFELSDAANGRFKQISPKKALSKVMNFYGDSFYRIDARQRTRENYQAIALKLDGVLAPQEERRGFLFFETKKRAVDSDSLSLAIKGATTPISVKLK